MNSPTNTTNGNDCNAPTNADLHYAELTGCFEQHYAPYDDLLGSVDWDRHMGAMHLNLIAAEAMFLEELEGHDLLKTLTLASGQQLCRACLGSRTILRTKRHLRYSAECRLCKVQAE